MYVTILQKIRLLLWLKYFISLPQLCICWCTRTRFTRGSTKLSPSYSHHVVTVWPNKQHFTFLPNLSEQIDKFGNLGLSWDGSYETSIVTWEMFLKSAQKNPNSLPPRMVLLHKHHQVERIREWIDEHKKRQLVNRRKDLLVPKSPSLNNEHTGPLNLFIDKSDNNDKNDDKIDDRGDEMRYYRVRIYPTKDVVMKRFQKGMCLSGFIFNKSQGLMYLSLERKDCSWVCEVCLQHIP